MKPGEMTKRLVAATTTLRNWEKSVKLPDKRTVSNSAITQKKTT